MKRRSTLSTLIALVAVFALAGTALAAAFSNGSFETGGPFVDHGGYYPVTGSEIDGWTVTAGTNVDWISTYWTASEGSRSIDLQGTAMTGSNPAGSISQTFDTIIGATYVITFDISANPHTSAPTASMTLDADAATAAPAPYTVLVSTAGTTPNINWAPATAYSFVASSTSTTITFASDPVNTSNQGVAIDNVEITHTLVSGAECKKDGWKTHSRGPFKNQGDCVSFFATGEKNLADPRD